LRAVGFVFVLPIALRRLPATELGLWYFFSSIAEFALTAELGMANIIGRVASYFMGGLSRVPVGGLLPTGMARTNTTPNFEGLAGLVFMARRVYFRLALGAMTFLLTIGLFIAFRKSSHLDSPIATSLATYAVLSLATILSILTAYWPTLLSGIGQVRRAQHALLAGLAVNYLISAVGLLSGAGILSLALGQLALVVTTFTVSYQKTKRSLPQLRSAEPQPIAFGEIWPATWRALLASFGAYGCTFATVLICGLVTNLETTASYGLSFRLAVVAHGLASVWLSVKTPYISTARAAGDWESAIRYVRSTMLPSAFTYLACAGFLWFFGPAVLQLLHSRTELLSPPLLAALFMMIGLDFFVGFHAAVILTANRFPHLRIYLASGLASIVAACVLGKMFGVAGVIAAPMAVQVFSTYWWIPRRCWQELRVPAAAIPESPTPTQ
jgi:O-antigen/teichoic acid export membrane protein